MNINDFRKRDKDFLSNVKKYDKNKDRITIKGIMSKVKYRVLDICNILALIFIILIPIAFIGTMVILCFSVNIFAGIVALILAGALAVVVLIKA